MIKNEGKVSLLLRGNEGHTHPYKYAREFLGGQALKLLQICCIQSPKLQSAGFHELAEGGAEEFS